MLQAAWLHGLATGVFSRLSSALIELKLKKFIFRKQIAFVSKA
jgi:hypothetical protein